MKFVRPSLIPSSKSNFSSALYVLTAILFVFSSCQNKTVEKGFYVENFDNMKWWTSHAIVTDEQAHSGSYATYTDANHEYSETFEMDLTFAKDKKYKRIQITAWCFKPAPEVNASLVASVESAEGQIVSQSHDFTHSLETMNTWINLILFLDLPENAPPGTKIKVYLISPKREKAFMDDVEIQFLK